MPYSIQETDHFLKVISKLRKKERLQYQRVRDKMAEIIENPQHYKPLSNKLKHYRRAHIGSFVIAFRIIEEEKAVKFVDFDHHDNIYERPYNE